jgi:RNA polymerase sigma-70 factor, ECF subfamily
VLWERLLFPKQGPLRLADYAGRSSLATWIRVAATRTAIDLERRLRREVDVDAVDDDIETRLTAAQRVVDPELALVQARYKAIFDSALQAALTSLDAEQRTMLRIYFLGGMSIDQIARAYGIHRSTAARWVGRAKDATLAEVRRTLTAQLRVSPSELDSLIRALRSDVELSFSELLSDFGS